MTLIVDLVIANIREGLLVLDFQYLLLLYPHEIFFLFYFHCMQYFLEDGILLAFYHDNVKWKKIIISLFL